MTRVVTLVAVVLAAVAAVGCSEPRSEDPRWREQWDVVVALVPEQDVFAGLEDPSDRCADVLGDLREARPMLEAPPDRALDETVETWFEIAETTFFECPPDGEELGGFDAAYDELASIEAEVDAVLPPGGTP